MHYRAFLSLFGGFAALFIVMSAHLQSAYVVQPLPGGASVAQGAGVDPSSQGIAIALAMIGLAFSVWYQRTRERKWAMINRVGRLVGIAAVLLSFVPTAWLLGR